MSDKVYAFPAANAHDVMQEGMTLRDYFAANAMQGWISTWAPTDSFVEVDGVARFAYQMADAMLKAREEK